MMVDDIEWVVLYLLVDLKDFGCLYEVVICVNL